MDRITRLTVQNVRAIEHLDLDLSRSLTVLIGENGSGKSTILECLQLLHRAADPSFLQQFYSVHRGLPGLLRDGATSMTLTVVIDDPDSPDLGPTPASSVRYALELVAQPTGFVQVAERIYSSHDQFTILESGPGGIRPWNGPSLAHDSRFSTALSRPDVRLLDRRVARMADVLAGIEVHLGFDSLASWAARTLQRSETVRGPTTLYPASRLGLLAANLTSAWSELRSQRSEHWETTLDWVRTGLGERVDTVVVKADLGGGNVHFGVQFQDLAAPVMASNLSDGQLAWLAFVAMLRLNEGRSLLAVDEPELHLHPTLLAGVVEMLRTAATPVLVATHADRVLEMLDDPAETVRVCALSERGRATVARLNKAALDQWLSKFGDLARLRSAGYLGRVVAKPSAGPGEGPA